MTQRAQLPALGRNERSAAAKASRERNDGRPLMSINQTATYLGKSRNSVYRLVRSGDLRAFSIEGVLRIRPSDVDDYVERNVVS